ncbi:PH domain-containing protein [Lysinibacillus sphaericus]|uniref:PH domain-containing protein n=1 Tax=Lysinibacillus TaxID=400634 RepID=UPI0009BF6612
MWFNTRYKIEHDTLQIPYGLIKIKSNRNTTNPFVAPSLSVHRIEINYEKYKTIQISPIDRQAFVEALQQKNPYIRLDN